MRADALKNRERLMEVAHAVVTEQGADASLREIARRANVGMGTLYRHFPSRDAVLEALLRERFDALTVRAEVLADTRDPDDALIQWLDETVAGAHAYSGAISAMVAAIADPQSALHSSCKSMKSAGAGLLKRAQETGSARQDVDGEDFFGLLGALAWIRDQPALAHRSGKLFDLVSGALFTNNAPFGTGSSSVT